MQLCMRDTVIKREQAAVAKGIEEIELMRNAAKALADAADACTEGDDPARVAIFCGRGKNGGDGYAAAQMLFGCALAVFDVDDGGETAELTHLMREQFEANGGKVTRFDPSDAEMIRFMRKATVVVDAMYGTGFHGELRRCAKEAARVINASPATVVSADLPSGVECDTGLCAPDAVHADYTVAFGCAKPAHYVQPAKTLCGKVSVADIGIAKDIEKKYPGEVTLVDEALVAERIKTRVCDTHKGDYGKLLVVGGSVGYTGAPCLVTEGAIRSGAGVVFLAVPERVYPIVAAACMREAVCLPMPATDTGFAKKTLDVLVERAKLCDAVALGPGLGRSEESDKLVQGLIKGVRAPLVLDADGINVAAEHIDVLRGRKAPAVVTPHDVEFKRLGGSLDGGRIEGAKALAAQLGAVVVLKGNSTVVASPDGRVCVNATGNPGMAKGGSGDLLSGVIASLAAQGLDLFDAAATGVWLHGRAGDLAAEELGECGMAPSDLAKKLPIASKPFCSRK